MDRAATALSKYQRKQERRDELYDAHEDQIEALVKEMAEESITDPDACSGLFLDFKGMGPCVALMMRSYERLCEEVEATGDSPHTFRATCALMKDMEEYKKSLIASFSDDDMYDVARQQLCAEDGE